MIHSPRPAAFLPEVLTCLLLFFCSTLAANSLARVEGQVRDASGTPVAGALVEAGSSSATTGRDGRFALHYDPRSAGELRASAPGFAVGSLRLANGQTQADIVLHVSRVEERVTVTANAAPAGATEFDRQDLNLTPAFSIDMALRQVPGFTLFRRTPSWAANGTAQGFSLRGVGASAASRGLVLLDGVPINDPFGGWVYWGRVPPGTLTSAEVVEGSASELYGTDAIGGVINLVRREQSGPYARVESSIGNLFTPMVSAMGTAQAGPWQLSAAADAFRTNGYVPVPERDRGTVDTVVSSEHRTGWVDLQRSFGQGGRVFVSGNLYGESRQNGTHVQTNSATVRELRAGADWRNETLGDFNLRLFGGAETLRQIFSAVAADRNTEALTRDQFVPAANAGATLLWSHALARRHMLVAGTEARWIDGESFEWAHAGGTRTSILRSGGTQRRYAAFGEDRIRLTERLLVSLAARVDHWENAQGFSLTAPLAASVRPSDTRYPDRSQTAFSPKLALSFAATDALTLHASVARGFRAPTLNELYRSFRVGNAVTLNNSDLRSERLTGVEAGATLRAGTHNVFAGTFFWNDITNPVSNVTLSITPALITRQKQNMGRLRSTGAELRWDTRLTDRLSVRTAYQFVDSTVADFAANPELEGLWIPQVARHNATLQARYAAPENYAFAVHLRVQGRQYDDDRNLFPLGGYAVIDAFASKNLSPGVELFLAAENLTNRRYEVGRTPVLTLGPPIVARTGLRWTFTKR